MPGVALSATRGAWQVYRAESRPFETAWFAKAARKAQIGDDELCAAVAQARAGQCDDLGNGGTRSAVALAAHLRANSGLLDRGATTTAQRIGDGGANIPRGLNDRHALCTEGDGDAVLLALKAMSEHADELPGISAPGS